MLRINLLPAYLAEQRKLRLAIVLSVMLFLIVTAAGLFYNFFPLTAQLTQITKDDTDDKAKADAEIAYEAKTASMLLEIAPLAADVMFVKQVTFYNGLLPKIYRNAARYTYRKVEYNSMSVTGNNLAVSGTVSSLDDFGRFYLTMFANPDVTAVSISAVPDQAGLIAGRPVVVPGGPPPAPPQYAVSMNATLISAVAPPVLPPNLSGTAAAPGAPAGVGAPGAQPTTAPR